MRRDHHLAERVPLAHPGEGLGHFVEPERAVDVDGDLAADAEIGQRLEVGRALLDREHARASPGDPTGQRADREHAQQRTHRSADAP